MSVGCNLPINRFTFPFSSSSSFAARHSLVGFLLFYGTCERRVISVVVFYLQGLHREGRSLAGLTSVLQVWLENYS